MSETPANVEKKKSQVASDPRQAAATGTRQRRDIATTAGRPDRRALYAAIAGAVAFCGHYTVTVKGSTLYSAKRIFLAAMVVLRREGYDADLSRKLLAIRINLPLPRH